MSLSPTLPQHKVLRLLGRGRSNTWILFGVPKEVAKKQELVLKYRWFHSVFFCIFFFYPDQIGENYQRFDEHMFFQRVESCEFPLKLPFFDDPHHVC